MNSSQDETHDGLQTNTREPCPIHCTCSCSASPPKESSKTKYAPDPEGDLFTQSYTSIGGKGGELLWHENIQKGAVVKGITVWKDDNGLQAIMTVFTDSTMDIAGQTYGESKTLRLEPGEKCTQFSLWKNKAHTRCGRIRIRTTRGQEFEWGTNYDKEEVPFDVGSGILAGFRGGYEKVIYSLGALFLKPIRRIVSSVEYDQLPLKGKNIEPIELDSFQYVNASSSEAKWDWRKGVSKTVSQSWSQSAHSTFGMSVSIEASVPKIISIGGNARWDEGVQASHETSESQTRALDWNVSGSLLPGKTVRLTAVTDEGKISLPYTSSVTIYFDEGFEYTYVEQGTFNDVTYSHVDVRVTDQQPVSYHY